jgi:hypothetical protein
MRKNRRAAGDMTAFHVNYFSLLFAKNQKQQFNLRLKRDKSARVKRTVGRRARSGICSADAERKEEKSGTHGVRPTE